MAKCILIGLMSRKYMIFTLFYKNQSNFSNLQNNITSLYTLLAMIWLNWQESFLAERAVLLVREKRKYRDL